MRHRRASYAAGVLHLCEAQLYKPRLKKEFQKGVQYAREETKERASVSDLHTAPFLKFLFCGEVASFGVRKNIF